MHIERLLTTRPNYQGDSFRIFPLEGDESRIIEAPHDWDYAAAQTFAPALATDVPALTQAIEENTTPSWLWQQKAENETARAEEYSVWHVVHRLAGSATYQGLKNGLLNGEVEARSFYDELSCLFLHRLAAIAPATAATTGMGWAYGIASQPEPNASSAAVAVPTLEASNELLDGLATASTAAKFHTILKRASLRRQYRITFTDTARDWSDGVKPVAPLQIMLNLQAFYQVEPRAIDIAALQHAVRLLTLFAALQNTSRNLELGFANLSSLLLMLGLPYDSAAGRTTAASLSAIIAATAHHAAADIAAVQGTHSDFLANRQTILRVMRNRQRAAWGETNDYDHLTTLPHAITIDSGADLTLIAAAREAWDKAVQAAQSHGQSIFCHVTPFESAELGTILNAADQGMNPLAALTITEQKAAESFTRSILPAALHALNHVIADDETACSLQQNLLGRGTLRDAPAINHDSLVKLGFTAEILARIESYLPESTSLGFAITPAILGTEFCHNTLKLSSRAINDPAFSLLRHLGFTALQIATADRYVYGDNHLAAANLTPSLAALFAVGDQITPAARLTMQAALQPFTKPAAVQTPIASPNKPAQLEQLVIDAWRAGVESLILERADAPVAKAYLPQRLQPAIQPAALPPRAGKLRASNRTLSLSRKSGTKASSTKRV